MNKDLDPEMEWVWWMEHHGNKLVRFSEKRIGRRAFRGVVAIQRHATLLGLQDEPMKDADGNLWEWGGEWRRLQMKKSEQPIRYIWIHILPIRLRWRRKSLKVGNSGWQCDTTCCSGYNCLSVVAFVGSDGPLLIGHDFICRECVAN
jgi:hypothetical protein